MPEVILRAEAKALGLKRYFNGVPCPHGHVTERQVSSGGCIICARSRYAVWRAEHPDKARSATIDWRSRNADHISQYCRDDYEQNKDGHAERSRRFYAANADRIKAEQRIRTAANPERTSASAKRWRLENPERSRYHKDIRQSRQRSATPTWLSREDRESIGKLYQEARRLTRETGVRYSVDHIVPLVSSEVCGLHVPWNLRVILHSENCSKKNSLDRDLAEAA